MSTIDGRVRDSVMAHRYRFLWAVQKHVPEVLADLERDVLPTFRTLFRDKPRMEPGEACTFMLSESGVSTATLWITWPSLQEALKTGENWIRPSWAADIRGAQLDPAGLKFRDAMEKWAATYNLCSEEILGDAFSTLLFWLVSSHPKRIWQLPGGFWTMDELVNAPKLRLEETWSFEAWPTVEKRLLQQIAAYKSEVKKYRETIGFDLENMRDSRNHHRWLALYQCKGMSPNQILNPDGKHDGNSDSSKVRHAIGKLAKTIGLPLRAGHRGPGRTQ